MYKSHSGNKTMEERVRLLFIPAKASKLQPQMMYWHTLYLCQSSRVKEPAMHCVTSSPNLILLKIHSESAKDSYCWGLKNMIYW